MVDEFALTEQEVYRRLNDISSDFLRWISGFG
jgi:hypothetical protein